MNRYSNKDMTGWDLSDRVDMNNLTIENLCLSQETPHAHVLPFNLTGVAFIACNLDNVFIPAGNTLSFCTTKTFKVQNDLEDWLVDSVTLLPIEPLSKDRFLARGLSINPIDIPLQKMSEPLTNTVPIIITNPVHSS